MNVEFSDVELNRTVRPALLAGIARICLTLGLGHFISVPLLLLVFEAGVGNPLFQRVAGVVTFTGIMLLIVAFLFRYENMRRWMPYVCFGTLFLQAALLLYSQKNLFHPVSAMFPLLVCLAAPVMGKGRSYALAGLSAVLFLGYTVIFVVEFKAAQGTYLAALMLMVLILGVSAYLAETLWFEILTREAKLRVALNEVNRRAAEMERWVQQLGQASSLISAGDYSAPLPKPPPREVFQELTRSVEQMQESLRQYFSDLLLKNRLSSLAVLAMGIAHELNTPLTTIEYILGADETIPEGTRERLQKELQQLAGIAKGLLTLAWEKTDGDFDLNALVKASEGFMRYMRPDGLKTHFDLAPGELRVKGALPHFQQLLVNLYQNAVDSMVGRKEQDVWISTEVRSDGLAVLVVRDNGIGMDKETLARVLEPFYTTKPGSSSGLGLFVVHQIVKAHGAALEMQSEPGKGTTVRIFLSTAGERRQDPPVRALGNLKEAA